jgi:hypothetical protein
MMKGNRQHALEGHAVASHFKSLPESSGLCFHATLALAQEARRMGLENEVAFVRWRVHGDLNFLEHWALVLEDGTVLDMTAVQVDGNPHPLRRVAGYPRNYARPRQYPAAIVLGVMERHLRGADGHFSRVLLWHLHARLFRHDAASAWRDRSPVALAGAVDEITRRAATLCLGYLLERALGRMSRLLVRLK